MNPDQAKFLCDAYLAYKEYAEEQESIPYDIDAWLSRIQASEKTKRLVSSMVKSKVWS